MHCSNYSKTESEQVHYTKTGLTEEIHNSETSTLPKGYTNDCSECVFVTMMFMLYLNWHSSVSTAVAKLFKELHTDVLENDNNDNNSHTTNRIWYHNTIAFFIS